MSRARWIPGVLTLLALLALPASGYAQGNTCNIDVTGVNFGSYNVFSGAPLQSTGGVSFRCGPAVHADTVSISLSTGQSGTFQPRALSQAGETLTYNLFRDAARTQIWGDGSSGTFAVLMAPEKNTWVPVTIYAEIPPLQDVTAGSYTDTVTATINF